ncbi:MAG TPA: universal stress protein [Streptosporangiaceae bacterium]
MSGVRRVIVGISGSPGSLPALRFAENLARVYDATLIPVLVWTPPGGDLADRRSPSSYLRRIWEEDAQQRLLAALGAAWGETPADLPVQPLIERGDAGPVLVGMACDSNDLLVIGAGHRGVMARILSGRVSRYCLAHAQCPVLAVPPPALARQAGRRLFRWVFWHRTLTPDQIFRHTGKTSV